MSRFISIGPAIAAGQPNENAGTTPNNNGATPWTGPGDECVYTSGYPTQFPFGLSWDVRISGGTFASLTVNLEASDDGTNWDIIDTNNSATGGSRRVQPASYRMYRCNVPSGNAPVSGSGTPVLTCGITI